MRPFVADVKRRPVVAGLVGLVLLVPVVQWVLVARYVGPGVTGGASAPVGVAPVRDLDPYQGYGTWVDIYDFAPSYQDSGAPSVTPESVDQMAELGVETVYVQAARSGDHSPGLLVDQEVLADLLVRSQEAGMAVVGWYLPRFDDVDRDLAHLEAIATFEVDGHRFDGVAVDIEWTGSVADHGERSRRLVELSRRLSESAGDGALGAIVLPPVQTEVVNPNLWPGFPWSDLAAYYDVWLPMGYWTERTAASGYRDGFVYTRESVQRLRANLGDPLVAVHPIGGIGNELTVEDAQAFRRALDEVDAIGGSFYDWNTLSPEMRNLLAGMF